MSQDTQGVKGHLVLPDIAKALLTTSPRTESIGNQWRRVRWVTGSNVYLIHQNIGMAEISPRTEWVGNQCCWVCEATGDITEMGTDLTSHLTKRQCCQGVFGTRHS